MNNYAYTLIKMPEWPTAKECGFQKGNINDAKTHMIIDKCEMEKCNEFGELNELPVGFSWDDTYPVTYYDKGAATGEVDEFGEPVYEWVERIEQEPLFDGRHLTEVTANIIATSEEWRPTKVIS